MPGTRCFGLACAVTVFVCLTAAPVSAQPLDQRTFDQDGAQSAVPISGATAPQAPDAPLLAIIGTALMSAESLRLSQTRRR